MRRICPDSGIAVLVTLVFAPVAGASWNGTDALPAELLLVDPASIAVTEMQAVA